MPVVESPVESPPDDPPVALAINGPAVPPESAPPVVTGLSRLAAPLPVPGTPEQPHTESKAKKIKDLYLKRFILFLRGSA